MAYADLKLRARIWADDRLSGCSRTARLWQINRDTVLEIRKQALANPEFMELCQATLDETRERLFAKADQAHMATMNAYLLALQAKGHSLEALTMALETTAHVTGTHRGAQAKNEASAKAATGGPAIALPFILTQPREETPAEPVSPPPAQDDDNG